MKPNPVCVICRRGPPRAEDKLFCKDCFSEQPSGPVGREFTSWIAERSWRFATELFTNAITQKEK